MTERRITDANDLRRLYDAGASLNELAAMLGRDRRTVRRMLLAEGVAIRPWGRRPSDSPLWLPEAIERYRAGEGLERLSRVYRADLATFRRRLEAAGVPIRDRSAGVRLARRRFPAPLPDDVVVHDRSEDPAHPLADTSKAASISGVDPATARDCPREPDAEIPCGGKSMTARWQPDVVIKSEPTVLAPVERRALTAATNRPGRFWRRYRAVLLLADGQPAPAVAATLGCNLASVEGWAAAYRRGGVAGLRDRGHARGRPGLALRAGDLLEQLLGENPRERGHRVTRWTVPLLRSELAVAGVAASERTVRRALHRMGWRWHPLKLTHDGSEPPFESLEETSVHR